MPSITRTALVAPPVVATAVTLPSWSATASASTSSHHPVPPLHVVKTLAANFVGPLQFAVAGNKVYVADDFHSTLNVMGVSKPIATGPDPSTGGDLAGVAVDPATHA